VTLDVGTTEKITKETVTITPAATKRR